MDAENATDGAILETDCAILESDGDTGRAPSTNDLLKLLERQGYRCALTGRYLRPDYCSLDHIMPRKHGGQHALANCQLVCPEANGAKGSMTQAEFLQLCREVVRMHGMGDVRI